MNSLSKLLIRSLQKLHVRSDQHYSRLVVGGLPSSALEDLFVALTRGDGSAWQTPGGRHLPVFLIKRDPRTDGAGLSRECNWDYALAIRNSFPSFLLLVDPDVWDDRTYSIVNATETIGQPLPAIRRTVPPLRRWSTFYADLAGMAAEEVGIEVSTVEAAIRASLKDLPQLDPEEQHLLPWRLLHRISDLSDTDHLAAHSELARVCGLLSLGSDTGDFNRNRAVLERLAKFLEDKGIEEGFEELRGTSGGADLERELDAMRTHLRRTAGSSAAFVRAPSFYYSMEGLEPSDWSALSVESLDELLAEVGSTPHAETISVSCVEPLNRSPSPGEPFLVGDVAAIRAEHPSGAFESLRVLRILGAQRSTLISGSDVLQSPFIHEDAEIPAHRSPLTYRAEALGATSASVQVISLEHYEPFGFVTCPGPQTRKLSRPKRTRAAAPWKQEIFLRNAGMRLLRVFCSSTVVRARITEPVGYQTDSAVSEGVADLELLFDDDVEVALDLMDSDDQVVSTIALSVAIDQDSGESAQSQFCALVRAHQDVKSTPSPARSRESWLRVMESELIRTDSSWRPVLATPGWPSTRPRLTETFQLGSLQLEIDPRPQVNPPLGFAEARQRVIDWLGSSPLPETDLADTHAIALAEEYLRAYREWFEHSPEEACWVDTVSILELEPGQYGGQAVAAFEPIAVSVSPLHAIRFGWHVAAQRLLSSGLDFPCPLAGVLDPHRCPEVLSLALARSGSEPRWASYVSISCQDAMWGLYWHSARLRDMQQHSAVTELVAAGVSPRGVQSGFTASQASKTLDEIGHILPTRATLRIGIVSSGQGQTSCTDGLIAWSRKQYGQEGESLAGPRFIELFDSRPDTQPSNEEISSLADDCGHRVRWYSGSETAPPRDLVIVDQLGIASPAVEKYPWMSPCSEGSLVRSRIRLDRNDAEHVIESRAGNIVRSSDKLLDELSLTIGRVEILTQDRGAGSHLTFVPRRQAISSELDGGTRFLAVSSTEIDPACFARSTPQAGGFLWDYELPHAIGPGEQRGGFYLLAQPPEAMRRAVLRATSIISQSNIDVDALLTETSRRGIPILKRLAAGGSLARGELGMLLAVRLLQDSFREQGQGRIVRLPVCDDGTIRMVLPVDPYAAPLEKVRQSIRKIHPELSEATRPDLLVACIRFGEKEHTRVRLVPLEIKFRDRKMSTPAKVGALAQAKSLGKVLHHLLLAPPPSELWRICGLAFLSEILDHGFRVYGDPTVSGKTPDEWVNIHQGCLADIASGHVTISIAEEGRLIVFDESSSSIVDDIDEDGIIDTLVVSREDSRVLLEDGVTPSDNVHQVTDLLDICSNASEIVTTGTGLAVNRNEGVDPPESDDSYSPPEVETLPNRTEILEPSVISPSTREQVNEAFSDFIGNRAAIDTLRRGILKAMLSDPPQLPVSYLLTGNPSTGKTELSRRVARALALPFVSLDGRSLASRERLFDLIDDRLRDNDVRAEQIGTQYQRPELEYPPLVVFVDEVHLVPKPVQESLLTALEPTDRSVLLKDRLARLPQVTFLFATTRPSDIDAAFRTRCTEILLQDYTEQEVATIVGLQHPEWPEPLRHRIARYGRLVPRIALEFARELTSEALVSQHQERDLAGHLDEVRRTRLVDENGLTRVDIEYLELLEREDGPLGERNILTMLGNIDKDRFIEEVEPLVVARMGLVRRTTRGRELTREGRRYLVEMRKARAESV